MTDLLDLAGRHYLTLDCLATPEQFQKVYLNWERVIELKRKHDSKGIISSRFFDKYAYVFAHP